MPASTLPGLEHIDAELEAGLVAILDEVEVLLHETVRSADPLVTTAARHLTQAGGKRFRPLLVAIGAHFGDPRSPGVVPAAGIVELTHLGTLYHDDVMDEAEVRRGAPSANSRWGNSVAILVGDYLFSRAADLSADLGIDAVKVQARTFSRLVHGQIAETLGPGEGADKVEHYLHVIAEKTGSLIATAGRYGGMFAGCPPEHVESLRRFGAVIGTAFQISDDVIDIASPSDDSGKVPGTDLREGVHTLPMLYALQGEGPAADRLRVLLARPITDDAQVAEALELLRTGPGLGRARDVLAAQAAEARAELGKLPACPAADALAALTIYVVDRTG